MTKQNARNFRLSAHENSFSETIGTTFPAVMSGAVSAIYRQYRINFLLIRGRFLLTLGKHEGANHNFRQALRLNWRHEQAAFWIGKAAHATIPTPKEWFSEAPLPSVCEAFGCGVADLLTLFFLNHEPLSPLVEDAPLPRTA